MTDQEKKDFEWASSFYLYDDLDGDWVNWDEEKFIGRRQDINHENKRKSFMMTRGSTIIPLKEKKSKKCCCLS